MEVLPVPVLVAEDATVGICVLGRASGGDLQIKIGGQLGGCTARAPLHEHLPILGVVQILEHGMREGGTWVRNSLTTGPRFGVCRSNCKGTTSTLAWPQRASWKLFSCTGTRRHRTQPPHWRATSAPAAGGGPVKALSLSGTSWPSSPKRSSGQETRSSSRSARWGLTGVTDRCLWMHFDRFAPSISLWQVPPTLDVPPALDQIPSSCAREHLTHIGLREPALLKRRLHFIAQGRGHADLHVGFTLAHRTCSCV